VPDTTNFFISGGFIFPQPAYNFTLARLLTQLLLTLFLSNFRKFVPILFILPSCALKIPWLPFSVKFLKILEIVWMEV
jgi:hypothetical protein